MSLLIDGYNLLYAIGLMPRGLGPDSLERARLALLNFLAESLTPEEIARTTVVFDAHDPPPGLPRTVRHRGITVQFASAYDEADTLIEELIRRDSSPRHLVVVSGDHRLHRAARHRRAKAVDSEAWYESTLRRRRRRHRAEAETSNRPPVPLLEEDVDYWIRQFGGQSLLDAFVAQQGIESQSIEGVELPPEAEDDSPNRDRSSREVDPKEDLGPQSPGTADRVEDADEGTDSIGQGDASDDRQAAEADALGVDHLFPPEYLAEIQDLLDGNLRNDDSCDDDGLGDEDNKI